MSIFNKNLYKETTTFLKKNNKDWNDVQFVRIKNTNFIYDIDKIQTTFDIDYDCGYGSIQIHSDLIVVGIDWWLERWEYDGSEGWQFNTLPLLQEETQSITVSPLTKNINDLK